MTKIRIILILRTFFYLLRQKTLKGGIIGKMIDDNDEALDKLFPLGDFAELKELETELDRIDADDNLDDIDLPDNLDDIDLDELLNLPDEDELDKLLGWQDSPELNKALGIDELDDDD